MTYASSAASRTTAAVVVAGLVSLGAATRARAENTNTNLLRAAAPASGYFAVEQPETIERGAVHVGATVDAGRRLLVVRDPMTDAIVPGGEVVAARLALHLAASLGVTDRLELTAALSLALQRGDETLNRPALRGTALGDLRLGGKLRLWQRRGFSVAGSAEISLPTSSPDAMFGDRTISLTPAVLAGARAGRVEVGAELGYRIRGESQFEDLAVNDEIVAGVAARYRLVGPIWAQAELDVAVGVQGKRNAQDRPTEALAGLRGRIDSRWLAHVGIGVGLGPGYGAPALRGLVMIGYAPAPAPARPERVAWTPAETPDERVDADPAPPPPANDAPEVRVIGDRIVLPAAVLFALDSADLHPEGRRVLGAVAQVWENHPEWAEMTVEGHADARGRADGNQRLSEQRAQQVRAALIELGIAPDRLHAVGFGASRPVTSGTSEAEHARNRRVELVITRRRVED